MDQNIKWNGNNDLAVNDYKFAAAHYTFAPGDFLLLVAYGVRNPVPGISTGVLFGPPENVYVDRDHAAEFETVCADLGITLLTEDLFHKFTEARKKP